MKRATILILLGLFCFADARPASAIDFGLGIFKRKPKPDSTNRVKALVVTLQSDPDEKKRRSAAEELRGFDPRSNPEVMTALMGSLQKDPSPIVRSESAETIGKLKPVSQPAGIAMEAASQSDPDPKVREAIKSALWQYHLNGYRAPAGQPLASQTPEPGFAPARPTPPSLSTRVGTPTPTYSESAFRPITNAVGKGGSIAPTTVEPPLAKPKPIATLPPPQPASSIPDTPIPMPSSIPTPLPSSIPTTPLPPITIPSVPTGEPTSVPATNPKF